MNSETKQAFATRVTQANKSELVVIVYEILEAYIDEAIDEHKANDMAGFKESMLSAQKYVRELMDTLDFKYDISKELMSLYIYINKVLIDCERRCDASEIVALKKITGLLRSGFEVVRKQDDSGPVMVNTQAIYAGLTYSKGNLNEMSVSTNINKRGFTA